MEINFRASRLDLDEVSVDSARYERISVQESEGECDLPAIKRRTKRMETLVDQIDEMEDIARNNPRARVKLLLDSMPFQVVMASCIMLNAAVIGGETDYPELEIWHEIENAFLLVFSLELTLRLFSVGFLDLFAPGDDQMWNIFDFSIVGLGVFDLLCEKLGAQSQSERQVGDSKHHGGGVSTLFRMIRLLRILRVFKIVRFLRQLYLIFFGFIEAIQAICLVSLLMFIVLYLCSVVMVRTYGRRLPLGVPQDDIANQFKSIKTSMMSLFELMSSPGNLQLYHSAMEESPILTLFLVSFVIFGSFGMIALLTGVISESMFEKNQTRVHELRQERQQKREILKSKCLELFALVDKDQYDRASPKDLEEALPYIREIFEKLDIEYLQHEFEHIISMCDIDDSGTITETEFVSGVLSLCDGVRAASILEVYYLVAGMNYKVTKMEKFNDEIRQMTKKTLPALQEDLQKIMQQLQIQPQSVQAHCSSSSIVRDHDGVTQWTESQLRDMKASVKASVAASMASTMDEHTVQITKKIDDLKCNLKELCKRQALDGHNFTLPETEITYRYSGGVASPVLPELWPADFESIAKGQTSHPGPHEEVRHITQLSPPLMVDTGGNPPGRVSSADSQNGIR